MKKIIQSKREIIALFQKTKDKRVYNFLKKTNYQVFEIEDFKIYKILDDMNITVVKNEGSDSLSVIKIKDKIIINTNDCVISEKDLEKIVSKLNINDSYILLTQFSYASWIGNPSEKHKREIASKKKLNQIEKQIEYFKPKITIPFASFIYYSHNENKYMNDSITDLDKVKNLIKASNSRPIFLYPGSCLNLNNAYGDNSFEKDFNDYKKDFKNIKNKNFIKLKIIEYNVLEKNSSNYLEDLYKKNIKFFYVYFL